MRSGRRMKVSILYFIVGYALAFGLIGWAAHSLIMNPPAPVVVARGAFRCDHSWRLPCDEVR